MSQKQVFIKLFLLISTFHLMMVSISHAQGGNNYRSYDPRLTSIVESTPWESRPEYMPRPHPSWEGIRARGNYVRKNEIPIAPLGYGVGSPPSKSAGKEFHPNLSGRRRSMGF
jgi:hypothetical protein